MSFLSSFNTTSKPIHVSVIGLGFVGGAMLKSFREKGCNVVGYDKYKPEYSNTFEQCCETTISFLCLPTVFDESNHSYDKSCIIDKVTRESGFAEEDIKLKAPDLSCFIQLRLALTPTVIIPFELTVVALNGVSPSKVKLSVSLMSFVDISTR